MDLTHIYCGEDGWGHLAAIIDCHDREIVGWEFSLRGRAREAERALEEACLHRFGTLRPEGPTPIDQERQRAHLHGRAASAPPAATTASRQEFITPYTPEQNGMIERFFRCSRRSASGSTTSPASSRHGRRSASWIRWYNERRPHQALGYLSPHQYRAQQLQAVA